MFKKLNINFLFGIFLALFVFCENSQAAISTNANIPIALTFTVDSNNADTFDAHLTIENKSDRAIENWKLGFSFVRPIQTIEGATVLKEHHISDYYLLQGQQPIAPYGTQTLKIHGRFGVKHITDAPAGYFLVLNTGQTEKIIPLIAKTILLPWQPAPGKDEYSANVLRNTTPIENNSLQNPPLAVADSLIVPLPAVLTRKPGEFKLNPQTQIIIASDDKAAQETAEFLVTSLQSATGYKLKIETNNNELPNNQIILTKQGATPDLSNEGYLLDVDPKGIVIRANTGAGLFYGVESLRQLLPPQIFKNQIQSQVEWVIPSVTIKDYPRFAYRGLLLDSARHFFPPDQVKRLLDLMALLKLNTFHWHLSDDEGWRIQIKYYPQLTNIGAWRGYNEVLPPALGSGAGKYGGFYTQRDISDIVQYAAARHITIIPEIDMPGHARAMIKSLPKLLIDPEDQSSYSTAQDYTDNILSPCMDSTYTVIDNIMTEVAHLFPGPYIHMGSDEWPQGAWEKSPKCIALMKKLQFTSTGQLQNYFARRVQTILANKGKETAGWEEIIKGGPVPNALVYAWSSPDSGLEVAKQGYDVVLAPAPYLYFDLAYNEDPSEPDYYWAGFVDTFKAYSFAPTAQFPPELVKKVKGIEGTLWSENIDSQARLDYQAFPKAAALAEVAWSPATRRDWRNFSVRLGELFLPELDNYGVLYRLPWPGINPESSILQTNIEFPGLLIRYTTNGKIPDQNSSIYTPLLQIPAQGVKMRAFDTNGRGNLTGYPP